jgi:hypothetical protein
MQISFVVFVLLVVKNEPYVLETRESLDVTLKGNIARDRLSRARFLYLSPRTKYT